MSDPKLRARNTPRVKAAKALLLREAYERLARAKRLGSHIEAVAILETLMSDRLEVLESAHSGQPTRVDTLGRLIGRAKNLGVLPEPLLIGIAAWAKSRNLAVHQLVKITNEDHVDWSARISFIRNISNEGEILLKELKREVSKASKALSR